MTKPKYFAVLDSLRFFACMGVIFTHSATFFNQTNLPKIKFPSIILNAGYFGVIFFYVLSGFLITYLLKFEKRSTGIIRIDKFYIRRILRIWPLYYLIIISSFLLFPFLPPWQNQINTTNSKIDFILYLLFLPNIVSLFRGHFNATCFHTYTVGYEEQFYLLWPFVIKKLSHYNLYILFILFLLPILLDGVHFYVINTGSNSEVIYIIKGVLTFINNSNFQAFVAGGIAGTIYLLPDKKFILKAAGNGFTLSLIAIIICLMYVGPFKVAIYVNVVSLVFALLILNLIQSPKTGNKFFCYLSQLGKFSYSMYIFHPSILLLTTFLLSKGFLVRFSNSILEYIEYLLLSLLIIFSVAVFTFKYFESIFLKKKIAFESISKEKDFIHE